MHMEAGAPKPNRWARVLRSLLTIAFADFAALMVALFAHVITSDASLLPPIEVLAAALLLFAVGSILVGVGYAWNASPQHRRAVAFVVAITAVTLLVHAFLIGLPAAATGGAVSGTAGSSFSDSHVSVDTTLSGKSLQVTLTATGGEPVADVKLTAVGQNMTGGGFSPDPTLASPLLPGTSARATWTLSSNQQTPMLDVTYDHLPCYSTSNRGYGCIMDEVFYVPEAMGILAGQQCSTGGPNCHMEHPPLVPALMAAGMAALGEYNSAGWRVLPAVMGSFSIPLVFGIAWEVSKNKKLAYASSALLALDVMFFSQSGGGLLDIPETFFGLLALFVYVANVRFWKLDRYVMAGVMLGLAALAKETAIFMAAALVTYVLFFEEKERIDKLADALKVSLVVGLVFVGGLQAYDSTLATSAVPTFVQHISYMLSYGSSLIANKLACQPTTGYWCKFANDPGGPPILPSDWVLYYSPVAYYATSVSVCPNTVNGVCQGGQYTYVALAYYGVTNLLETWTIFVWVPVVVYALYRYRRRPPPTPGTSETMSDALTVVGMPSELKFGALALVWFLWNYLPYIALFFYGRVTYPFYFIPAIPALAMGTAYWITRAWFPKGLVWVYLGMVFVFFFVYFPDKSFLPDWLRVLIGH